MKFSRAVALNDFQRSPWGATRTTKSHLPLSSVSKLQAKPKPHRQNKPWLENVEVDLDCLTAMFSKSSVSSVTEKHLETETLYRNVWRRSGFQDGDFAKFFKISKSTSHPEDFQTKINALTSNFQNINASEIGCYLADKARIFDCDSNQFINRLNLLKDNFKEAKCKQIIDCLHYDVERLTKRICYLNENGHHKAFYQSPVPVFIKSDKSFETHYIKRNTSKPVSTHHKVVVLDNCSISSISSLSSGSVYLSSQEDWQDEVSSGANVMEWE